MVKVIRAKRRHPVLTPSGLACLSTLPTINLTAGCLHDCAYCYIRGYRNYPGESRIMLYENTLELLRQEFSHLDRKPHAVYFSPSSDLFQPAPELLELSHCILEFLFDEGVAVAFLTKGVIPDTTLQLLINHRQMVQAQIGLITLDECVSQMFEPHAASPLRRLVQLTALTEGGVATMARMDPILPGITNGPELLDNLMAALAATSVKSIAAGILFLRPGILYWLKSRLRDKSTLARLLDHYRDQQKVMMRGSQYPVWNLPLEARREIFARIGEAATANSIELKICACKNPDLATGSCNIAGTRSGRTPPVRPPCTLSASHRTIHPSVVEQARQEDCTALISA